MLGGLDINQNVRQPDRSTLRPYRSTLRPDEVRVGRVRTFRLERSTLRLNGTTFDPELRVPNFTVLQPYFTVLQRTVKYGEVR